MAYGDVYRYSRRYVGNARRGGGSRRRKSSYKRSYSRPRRSYRKKSKKRYGKRDSSGKCVCPGDMNPGQKFLLAQMDPFDPKALGCKIPDSSTQPSVAIACQELYSVVNMTLATNSNCTAFLPCVTAGVVRAVESSAGTWTWPATFGGTYDWAKRSDMVTAVEVARPVSHGLRISSSCAPTSATGFVHLALAVEAFNGVSTWPYAASIGQLSGYSWYKRVTLASLTQTPITIINKYVDETAFRYLALDQAPAAGGTSGANPWTFHIPLSWGALLVATDGVPLVHGLQCEMILHEECIPKNVGVLSGSSAAAVAPGILAAAASVGANTDFAHTEEQQDSYMAQAAANAQAGATAAGNAFMNNVIAPAAYNTGYSLANQAIGAALTGIAGIAGINSNPHRLELS